MHYSALVCTTLPTIPSPSLLKPTLYYPTLMYPSQPYPTVFYHTLPCSTLLCTTLHYSKHSILHFYTIVYISINLHLAVHGKIDWFLSAGKAPKYFHSLHTSGRCLAGLLEHADIFWRHAKRAGAGKLQAIQKITCPAAIILRCTKVLLKDRKSA